MTALGVSSVQDLSSHQKDVINSLIHVDSSHKEKSQDVNLNEALNNFMNSWKCDNFLNQQLQP